MRITGQRPTVFFYCLKMFCRRYMFIMFEDADNNFVYKQKKDADNYATTRVLATWNKFFEPIREH